MREDNGVFRHFINYIINIAEKSIVLADYLQRKACAWHGPAHLPRQLLAKLLQPPCEAEALTSSMNTKMHAQTKIVKLDGKRSFLNVDIYASSEGRTGLIDMASCCRCTASVRGLAVIVNIGARAPCQ